MALKPAVLAAGQLPAPAAALYTVPTGYTAVLLQLHLYNSGAGANTVTLSWTMGAAVRISKAFVLAPAEDRTLRFFLPLLAAQVLQGGATNAAEVNYHAGGLEGVP